MSSKNYKPKDQDKRSHFHIINAVDNKKYPEKNPFILLTCPR